MITDEEVMRLFERADPARNDDSASVLDAARYLDALAARDTEMALVEREPADSGRASYRRWRVLAAAAAAAALIVATIVLVRTASDDGGTVLTPAGPAPSQPPSAPSVPASFPLGAPLVKGPDASSTLLTSWAQFHVGYVFAYGDGRVLWYPDIGARVDADMEVSGAQRLRRSDGLPAPYGEFRYQVIERHLSPLGLELLLAGQLDLKGLLVGPYPYSRRELWAEPTARLYEAPTYAICHTPADLAPPSAQLPASAQALLSGKQRTFDPKIGWSSEPMPESFEVLAEHEVLFPSDCFEVSAAEASTLYQILDANGMIDWASPTTQSAGVPLEWSGGSRSAETSRWGVHSVPHISSSAIYPHGQPVIWGG